MEDECYQIWIAFRREFFYLAEEIANTTNWHVFLDINNQMCAYWEMHFTMWKEVHLLNPVQEWENPETSTRMPSRTNSMNLGNITVLFEMLQMIFHLALASFNQIESIPLCLARFSRHFESEKKRTEPHAWFRAQQNPETGLCVLSIEWT